MHLTRPAGVGIQILGGIMLIFGLIAATAGVFGSVGLGLVGLVLILGGIALLRWGRQPAMRR